ncbi:MAG: TetR/AcrR family transcriptional regulator [Oscillospiraceae bacterium]|nr:TetR/AcrR family transcriptional regulator [Oscillospiraceae bacterium]
MSIEEKSATKRTIKAQSTRRTIFENAVELFAQYGYEKVTVDDIAARSGVSKGAFYHHFPTKEAILVEQFDRIDEAYEQAFAQADPDMSAGGQLVLLVDTMTDYCSRVCGINVIRTVYAGQAAHREATPILYNRERAIYRYLGRIVDRGLAAGEFAPIDPSELTELLMRACRSLVYDWCLYGEQMDLVQEGRRFAAHLLRWIAPKS